MAQLLEIFAFLSVVLRGLNLAFEALVIGGVVFRIVIAKGLADQVLARSLTSWLICASTLLACVQFFSMAANSTILIGSTDMELRDVVGADFWAAGTLCAACTIAIAVFARCALWPLFLPVASAGVLFATAMSSHAVARLEHRPLLVAATLVHHLAGDAWIGGLLYILVFLRHTCDVGSAGAVTRRFSTLAMISVTALACAGSVLSLFYIGSRGALFGTTYGVMLMAKLALTMENCSIFRTVFRDKPNWRAASRMLMPSTCTARLTRAYTSTWYTSRCPTNRTTL